MLNGPFFTTQRTTLIQYLIIVLERKWKIVGLSACPGERAHDVTFIVILKYEWSLSFKAEILVTAVTN